MLRNLQLPLTVEGISGRTYTLNQYSFDDFDDVKGTLPEYGGIYVFTRCIQSHTLVYCGKADSFRTRFYNHHAESCIRRNGANRISIMRVDREADRAMIETDILERYTFACNIQHNC